MNMDLTPGWGNLHDKNLKIDKISLQFKKFSLSHQKQIWKANNVWQNWLLKHSKETWPDSLKHREKEA